MRLPTTMTTNMAGSAGATGTSRCAASGCGNDAKYRTVVSILPVLCTGCIRRCTWSWLRVLGATPIKRGQGIKAVVR